MLAFLLGSLSAFSQNLCLSGFDFGDSVAQVMKNHGVPEIRVFLGWILAILWPKVTNNYGVPEIKDSVRLEQSSQDMTALVCYYVTHFDWWRSWWLDVCCMHLYYTESMFRLAISPQFM